MLLLILLLLYKLLQEIFFSSCLRKRSTCIITLLNRLTEMLCLQRRYFIKGKTNLLLGWIAKLKGFFR